MEPGESYHGRERYLYLQPATLNIEEENQPPVDLGQRPDYGEAETRPGTLTPPEPIRRCRVRGRIPPTRRGVTEYRFPFGRSEKVG